MKRQTTIPERIERIRKIIEDGPACEPLPAPRPRVQTPDAKKVGAREMQARRDREAQAAKGEDRK